LLRLQVMIGAAPIRPDVIVCDRSGRILAQAGP
jgi:hypothetical protein